MKTYPEIIQGSDEWRTIRGGMATASCFSKALAGGTGKTRKDYMIKLIAERMTGIPEESYSNAVMQRGNEIEPDAREFYEMLYGVPVVQVGFISRDEDVGASPDGLVGSSGMLEIKSPNSSTHITTLLADKMPTKHKTQVQGNLWVAEREWIDFMSYDPRVFSRPSFIERIYRDDKYIKEMAVGIIMFVTELKELMEKLTNSAPF